MSAKRDPALDRTSLHGRMGVAVLLIAFCLAAIASTRAVAATEASPAQRDPGAIDRPAAVVSRYYPVYRIPLRVHLKESGRSPEAFKTILEEINDIWLSQAGVCFEMQEVLDDRPAEQGMDIWFQPVLPGGRGVNGYYRSDHDIRVRDTPILRPAEHPSRYPASRTAAHELGHGLSLQHRQDSDDNLMRSKTFGWRLNAREIGEARRTAAKKALPDTTQTRCGEPRVLTSVGKVSR